MRFWHGQRVPDIARTLHLDQKKLYKRLDKLFQVLRRELEKAGFSQADGLLGGI
jgi:DNA-directed RNA polymerase specialized sigma24 family protein